MDDPCVTDPYEHVHPDDHPYVGIGEEPPGTVAQLEDIEGCKWERQGDRWFMAEWPNGDRVADDMRVYWEWWEIQDWAPFTPSLFA